MGTDAMLQFLRDMVRGEGPSHLIKLVLLGDQRAGKSSLADSLVLGRPATRDDKDRTVGIEVRRWRLGGQSLFVANIYDAARQRVYRATHGFFMSAGAFFLHVVRSDMSEDAAVAALLEWVEAVQQEASGAVMGVLWTHVDWAVDVSNPSFPHASSEELHQRHMVRVPKRSSNVMTRVEAGIQRQVQAVDEALQQLEDDVKNMWEPFAQQMTDLLRKWGLVREKRDAALVVLDRQAIVGCENKDQMEREHCQRHPETRTQQLP